MAVTVVLTHSLSENSNDGERGDHLLITPPFIITEAQCDEVVALLEETLAEVGKQLA